MKRNYFFLAFFVLLLLILLRYNSISSPFERDEGDYAYNARLLLQGGVPYRETFLHKPPLIVYTYALGQIIDRDGVWTPRVLVIVFIFLTSLCVAYIARKEYGAYAMYLAPLVFVIMSSFPYFTALSANTELFMILPMTACLAIYVRWKHDKIETDLKWQFLLFSILAFLSFGYKPISIFPLSLLYILWVAGLYKRHKKAAKLAMLVYWSSVGAGISFLLIFGYFLYKGAMWDAYDLVITFNRYYVTQFGFTFDFLFQKIWLLVEKWPVLVLLSLSAILTRPKGVALYASLIAVSLPAFINTPIGHYYILIMPFWAILTGASIQAASDTCTLRYSPNASKISIILVSVLCIISMLWVVKEQFMMTPQEITLWVYGRQNPFIESIDMAERITQYTSPGELIYIAGTEPQILFYADRRHASKYEISYAFGMKTPYQKMYQHEARNELIRNRPKAIVLAMNDESGFMNVYNETIMKDYVLDLVDKEYKLVGGEVWERGGVYWREKITSNNVGSASLLLFIRK